MVTIFSYLFLFIRACDLWQQYIYFFVVQQDAYIENHVSMMSVYLSEHGVLLISFFKKGDNDDQEIFSVLASYCGVFYW